VLTIIKGEQIMHKKINGILDGIQTINNKWIAMDMKLREEILDLLPKAKRAEYEKLNTDDLFHLAGTLLEKSHFYS